MDALLIQAPMPETIRNHEPYPPLGLAYIAAVLESEGFTVRIWDPGVHNLSVESTFGILSTFEEPDVVGLGCSTITYKNALRIASWVRNLWPQALILIGGCHVTFRARETLLECPEIDVVVRNEGEYAVRELGRMLNAGRRSFQDVSGITFRSGGRIVETAPQPPEQDLDALPFPARHLLDSHRYVPAIVASRGCTRRCSFCSAGAMNQGYRVRSAGNVLNELRSMDLSQTVTFYDNTFSGDRMSAIGICQAIMQAGLDFQWACELRVDGADRQLLQLMHAAGCQYVNFGVESASAAVLRQVHKAISTQQVIEAVETALDLRFQVTCSFSIGHPADTEESLEETLVFIKRLQSMGATTLAAIVTPFPGTEISDKAAQLGVVIEDFDWEHYTLYRPVMSTSRLSREQIAQWFARILLETQSYIAADRSKTPEPQSAG